MVTNKDGLSRGAIGHILDLEAEIHISSHSLPHWMQDGAITFVTFRLADSLSIEVIERWKRGKLDFLARKGIHCTDYSLGFRQLSEIDRRAFNKQFDRMKHDELDACHGRCQLQDPRAAQSVADSLLHFDNDRYLLGDFVIMPNHVHLLVVFPKSTQLRKQCYSWTHFTAVQINRLFGDSGTLWQEEPFDHLVRSEVQLAYLRKYIRDNPIKAKLDLGMYLYRKSARNF